MREVIEKLRDDKNLKFSVKNSNKRVRVSKVFLLALSIVSILGFFGIISDSFFESDESDFDMGLYIESLLMIIIGGALVLEAKFKSLTSLANGFNSVNFPRVITITIGVIAIIAGIFSFPGLRVESASFSAVKGLLSIIAIVIIIIQTWIIKEVEQELPDSKTK